MGRDECHRAQCYFINCSFAVGVLPYYYAGLPGQTIVFPKSKWIAFRYYVTVILCELGRIILFGHAFYEYIAGTFVLNTANLLRLLFLAAYGFSGVLHAHTYWKRYELPFMMNGHHFYYDEYVELYGDAKKIENDTCGVVMKFMLVTCVGTIFFMASLYSMNCQFHFWAPILPVCTTRLESDGITTTWWHSLYVLIQFAISVELITGCFPYLAFPIPAIFAGADMIGELRDLGKNQKTNGLIQQNEHWYKHFRCCQLMTAQFNESIAQYMIPFQLASLGSLSVITNFFLLKIHGIFSITIVCFGADVLCLSFIYIGMKKGAEFWELSKLVIQERKETCTSPYLKRKLRACAPFGGKISSLRIVDKSVALVIFAAIIDYTITLTLAH